MNAQLLPAAVATQHRIRSVEVTHHRIACAPPFHASWDTKPREHFDATIVRVDTDTGLTGFGSGDLMLGFRGSRASVRRPGPARRSSATTGCCRTSTSTMAAAGRSIWRSGTWPAKSPASPAGSCSAGSPTACAPTPPRARCADAPATGRRSRALSRAGISGAEDPLPSRRLAR